MEPFFIDLTLTPIDRNAKGITARAIYCIALHGGKDKEYKS